MKLRAGSQNAQILEYLRTHSHITAYEALGLFRCFRLAARIFELKRAGYKINTDTRHDVTGKTYARYSLA